MSVIYNFTNLYWLYIILGNRYYINYNRFRNHYFDVSGKLTKSTIERNTITLKKNIIVII